MRSNLRRSARDAPADSTRREKLTKGADAIHAILKGLRRDASIDSLRGAEGDASSRYFAAIDAMQRRDPGAFAFEKRTRRPPLNPMNALLSFLYSLLMHDCAAALQSTGLDPAVGFLHSDRPGRLSLALDLMEEFRASLADRLALTLINRKQIIPEGFKTRESGAVEMDDDTRRSVLIAWQERKREALTHPFTNERCTWGLAPFIQSRLLARTIRGDLDAYPPFSVK